jgi:hypothetical protein
VTFLNLIGRALSAAPCLLLRTVAAVAHWCSPALVILALWKAVTIWLSIAPDLGRLGELTPALALFGGAAALSLVDDAFWMAAMYLRPNRTTTDPEHVGA